MSEIRNYVDCPGGHLGRRSFLRVGSLSLLGMSLSHYLRHKSLMAAAGFDVERTAKAQSCVLIWLEGGPSQVDTWDPKSNSSFKPISTNVAGIQISELLPRVARCFNKLAIVRSVHTEENNHGQATYYAMTGHRPTAAMQFPSFASIITKEAGPRGQVPPHVLVPGWKGGGTYEGYLKGAFLGPSYDPMVLSDPSQAGFRIEDLSLPKTLSENRLEQRRSLLSLVDHQYRQKVQMAEHLSMDSFSLQALKMVLEPGVREAFDLTKESEKTKEAYGRNSFGQSLLLARRLVEAGSRFVTAAGHQLNSWDTHADNDKRHKEKLTPLLDQTLPVFLEDLEQRGLLKSTLVLLMGEFGRSPHLNSKAGRDHWPHCWSVVMGGGGIRAGQVVGASDERGAYVADREVSMGDVFATVYKAFGIDWHKEYMSPIGRPVKIANSIADKTGVPIKEFI